MKQAYESVKNGKSTVILGSAGSGKSTFINYLENNGLKILKLAPTGVASAIRVDTLDATAEFNTLSMVSNNVVTTVKPLIIPPY